MPEHAYLSVPVRVDALHQKEGSAVLEPMHRFERLPWMNTTPADTGWRNRVKSGSPRDVGSDVAYLSENVETVPFSDRNFWLKPGIHLHWSLPFALTMAAHPRDDDGRPDPSRPLRFPVVPNRWMITRRANGQPSKTWVVESDYLWPHDSPGGGIPYPISNHATGTSPYRFLGRVRQVQDRYEEDAEGDFLAHPTTEHHADEKLTAVGYGEHTFAEFYPNCHSVFGLHDPDVTDEIPPGLQYEVMGWYSPHLTQDDPLQRLMGIFRHHHSPAIIRQSLGLQADHTLSDDDVIAAFAKLLDDEYNWQLPQAQVSYQGDQDAFTTPTGEVLTGIVCVGKVQLDASPSSIAPDKIDVVVGNTGSEALAKYLASQMDDPAAENQLLALTLTEAIADQRVDLGARFEEARHSATFSPVSNGIRWTLRVGQSQTSSEVRPSDDPYLQQLLDAIHEHITDELHHVNRWQEAYQRGQAIITDLQRQVYADWNKYMLSVYRPADAAQDYPDIDLIKRRIEMDIAWLNVVRRFVGVLQTHRGEAIDVSAAQVPVTPVPTEAVHALGAEMALLADDRHVYDEFAAWYGQLTTMSAPPRPADALVHELAGVIFPHTYDYLTEYPPDILPSIAHHLAQRFRRLADLLEHIAAAKRLAANHNDDPAARIDQTAQMLSPVAKIISPLDRTFQYGLASLHGAEDTAAQQQMLARIAADLEVFTLSPEPGAPSWQPNEPQVLLAGVRPSPRHRNPAIPCRVAILDLEKMSDADGVDTLLDEDNVTQTDGASTYPFLLEWELDVLPVAGGNTQNAAYPFDFVTRNYDLRETKGEFLNPNDLDLFTASAATLTGRAVLTPHASNDLQHKIDAYLTGQTLAYLHSKPAEQLQGGEHELLKTADEASLADYFDANKQAILAWCDEQYQVALVNGYFSAPIIAEENLPDAEQKRQELTVGKSLPDDKLAFLSEHQRPILAWYALHAGGKPRLTSPAHVVEQARDHLLSEGDAFIQSQSLSGFNSALLMLRQTLQLPVADPLGFEEYRRFSDQTVRQAVGRQNRAAPEPAYDFHPIRTGAMQIKRLRLVDNFGQVTGNLVENTPPLRTSTLETTQADWIALPARITQPARIDFRWLDATERRESNAHPNTSPICGWVMPDMLDGSLMIYASEGHPLGSVDIEGHWRTVPGQSSGPVRPEDIRNPHLARMVRWICGRAAEAPDASRFMRQLIDLVESALENIDPANFAQHEAAALLMGRPLALIRARLDLQLRSNPAHHQGWDAYRARLAAKSHYSDRFESVDFPIRIGEHAQLNDGVVGYWLEDDRPDHTYQHRYALNSDDWQRLPEELAAALKPLEGRWFFGLEKFAAGLEATASTDLWQSHWDALTAAADKGANFFAPQSHHFDHEDADLVIFGEHGPALQFYQSIADAPQTVSMLIDVQADAHCTTGVLPTQVLRVSPHHYSAALRAIQIMFLSTPVLTMPGRVEIPLPSVAGWDWSWIQRDEDGYTTRSTVPIVERQSFLNAFEDGSTVWDVLITNKWIKPVDEHAERAIVLPQRPDLPTADPDAVTDVDWHARQADIARVLDVSTHVLGPTHRSARFGPTPVIREGWLKLTRQADTK